MVSGRAGKTSLGCLVILLLLSAAAYWGTNVGEVYWRYYQYLDDMKQQVRFAANLPNEQILRHLASAADSLGLPPDAGHVDIQRANHVIIVQSDYDETVELPLTTRDIHLTPRAQSTY